MIVVNCIAVGKNRFMGAEDGYEGDLAAFSVTSSSSDLVVKMRRKKHIFEIAFRRI